MAKDVRKYSEQTKYRLVIWFIAILFIVGLGLIWLIIGERAALLGLLCLIGSALPIGLIVLFMKGLDTIVKKQDE